MVHSDKFLWEMFITWREFSSNMSLITKKWKSKNYRRNGITPRIHPSIFVYTHTFNFLNSRSFPQTKNNLFFNGFWVDILTYIPTEQKNRVLPAILFFNCPRTLYFIWQVQSICLVTTHILIEEQTFYPWYAHTTYWSLGSFFNMDTVFWGKLNLFIDTTILFWAV